MTSGELVRKYLSIDRLIDVFEEEFEQAVDLGKDHPGLFPQVFDLGKNGKVCKREVEFLLMNNNRCAFM